MLTIQKVSRASLKALAGYNVAHLQNSPIFGSYIYDTLLENC